VGEGADAHSHCARSAMAQGREAMQCDQRAGSTGWLPIRREPGHRWCLARRKRLADAVAAGLRVGTRRKGGLVGLWLAIIGT